MPPRKKGAETEPEPAGQPGTPAAGPVAPEEKPEPVLINESVVS